jgi:hypothetical protein
MTTAEEIECNADRVYAQTAKGGTSAESANVPTKIEAENRAKGDD